MPPSKKYIHRYYHLFACSIEEGEGDGPDPAEIRIMTSRPTPSFEPPPHGGKPNSSPPLLHLALVKNKKTWFSYLLSVCNPAVEWREKAQTLRLEHSLETRGNELNERWQEAYSTWQEGHAAKQAFEILKEKNCPEKDRQQAVDRINFRRRLGSWTAAIGLIPLGVDTLIAPITAGIPVITLGYRIFQAVASWRREVRLAKHERRLTRKAQVMFDSTEILGATIIQELQEQLERADQNPRACDRLRQGENDVAEFLDDQVMRTRRICYSDKSEREKITAVGAIIGGLLDMQMRRLLDDFSEPSGQNDVLIARFETVRQKLARVRTSSNTSEPGSTASTDRVSPAAPAPTSRETRRSNSSYSVRFASSAVIPAVRGVSSNSVGATQSQTSNASTQIYADQTDIEDTVAHCYELAEYCLQQLPA